MDLVDVSRQQSDSDGVLYLLSTIDVLSKYAYLMPLKTKEGNKVARAADQIFDDRKPQQCYTDRGQEFKSVAFKNLLRECRNRHFFAGGSGKATVVERFHRTMRAHIGRYQYKKNTMKYIDVLPELVKGYKTYHHSIQMRPVDITEDNEHVTYEHLYAKCKLPKIIKFQFKIDDSFRITGDKHPFRREFFQR